MIFTQQALHFPLEVIFVTTPHDEHELIPVSHGAALVAGGAVVGGQRLVFRFCGTTTHSSSSSVDEQVDVGGSDLPQVYEPDVHVSVYVPDDDVYAESYSVQSHEDSPVYVVSVTHFLVVIVSGGTDVGAFDDGRHGLPCIQLVFTHDNALVHVRVPPPSDGGA